MKTGTKPLTINVRLIQTNLWIATAIALLILLSTGCAGTMSERGEAASPPELQAQVEWLDDRHLAVALTGARGMMEDETAFQQRAALIANTTAESACKSAVVFLPNHDANLKSGMGNSSRFTVRVYQCEGAN